MVLGPNWLDFFFSFSSLPVVLFPALVSYRRHFNGPVSQKLSRFSLMTNHLWSPLCPAGTLQSPFPSGKSSPEQRSFRDRQKYFEIDVKQQTPEKPKARVSLVGEDDLKKMREEEGWPSLPFFSLST